MCSFQASRVFNVLRAILTIYLLVCFISGSEMARADVSTGLSIVSGNGQVSAEHLNSPIPLTVQARDSSGKPLANTPLTWTVSQGQGTIVYPPDRTDASGMGSAYFRGDVTPGHSYSQQTITVSSSVGFVNFVFTVVVDRQSNGDRAGMPTTLLTNPPAENRNLSGLSGATLPDAINVLVGVQSGPEQGYPIPNVGIRIVDGQDLTIQPVAHCASQTFTDFRGVAHCDLILTGAAGTYAIAVEVGEFVTTPPIFLKITGSTSSCTYPIAATSQQFNAGAGIGTLTVNTQNGCAWSAVSNANWITVLNPSGTGYGGTGFNVAANSGAARTGSITIGGQSIPISQNGTTSGGPLPLSIVTGSNLPAASVGGSYNASLAATGGVPPYTWTLNGIAPAALTLNPTTGSITGTTISAGTFNLPVTLRDQAGSILNQTFTLISQIGGVPGGNGPSITNSSFPSGTVGVAYRQLLTSVGGCATPFSPAPVYSIASGSLPAGLSVSPVDDRTYAIMGTPTSTGTFNFTLTVTDSCNGSGSSNFTLVIGGSSTGGSVSASPSSLTFSIAAGQTTNPPDQTITLSGPTNTLFNLGVSTLSGGAWLGLTGQNLGTFPGTVGVRVANPGNLAAGNYTGSVSVISNAGVLSIPVTLTVSGPSTSLVVSQTSINAIVTVGSGAVQQTFTVSNNGPARFTILASTANGGSWLSVNAVSADTPANLTVTLNPAGLQPSIYSGTIQLLPTSPIGNPVVIPVTLRVQATPGLAVAPSGLTFINQAGLPPAASQTLIVTSTGAPVDTTIAATTKSGGSWLFATPTTGSTPLTVAVSVNAAGLFPGTYQGAIVVASGTQAVTPVSIPVTLTIPQTGGPALTAVVNAANFQPGPVSPGEIITVFGTSIGPGALVTSHVNAAGALDALLGGTRIYFDGIPAPLIYSSTGQVSAIVPYEVAGNATTLVEVEYQGVRSLPMTMTVAPSAPALFTFSASGQGPAAALNEDTSYNTAASGAEPGSIVVLYGTGEGQTNPGGIDGLLAISTYPAPLLPVFVSFGGQNSQVLYAGAAPGLAAGLLQINARLPKNLPRGAAIPVVIRIGNAQSQAGVTVFTKQ